MEKESFLEPIVAVVMAVVILSVVLVPIVDSESSYYVGVDENNDNPLTGMMFTYTEQPVSKTYSLAYNGKEITVSGDYNGVVSSEINQILIGTDNWSIVVEENTIWETKDGYSRVIMGKNMGGSYTVTISNGIVEGQSEPYQYLYYPDEFGVYANYSSYRYDTEDAYSVGSFAGISAITKGGEIQNETVFDMTAEVLYDDGTNEYTGVEFYPAPEPESEEESVEEDVEVHAAYDGSSGAAAASVGSPNPVAVASFQGMVHNAQINPSHATLVGDLWYDVRSGNAIVVGVRDSSLTQIVIPSSVTVDGTSYTVVGVAKSGNRGPFQNMTSLISLTIPDTLTHFGDIDPGTGAEGTQYGASICYRCTSLSTFSFGSSSDLQWIGDYAFYGCTNLNLSSLPSSVRVIGSYAFADCPNVTISSLSSEIAYVKSGAFSNTGITTFSFPNTAINVGNEIFRNCVNLTSVTLSNETTAIPNNMFNGCTSLVSVNIPSSVTSIGDYAFQNCSNLALSSLPTTMTNIGRNAFNGCTAVTFPLLPYGLTTINQQTFSNCPNVTFSSIPDTVTTIGNSAFYGCTNVTFSMFPSSVTSIGDTAFANCTNVRFDELPENLTSLGSNAFARCENIIISKIPDGVTTLSGSPFLGCTSIRSMDLNNVSSISGSSYSGGAFANCTALTSVTGLYITQLGHSTTGNPSHITSSSDFLNCTSLTSVNLPNLVEIGSQAFMNSGIIDIYFPHVTGIDTSVFENCANLRTVDLPSLTDIWGIRSMAGCPSLVSVNIPQVTVLPAWTFDRDSNLVTVNVGSLSSIQRGCFYNCAKLESTIDCSDCTIIEIESFRGCTNLEHVILGENLTSIKSNAFNQCTNLKITKDMPIYATEIRPSAFAYCSSIESLYLPNVETMLQNSFSGVEPPFEYCGAKEVIAPKLREIGQTNPTYSTYGGVFVNMPNLEHLELPSLTHMYAKGVSMSNLSNNPLRNLELPSIEHIATNGIYNTSLESLILGDNIETIGTQAITFNPNLLTVIIPGNPVIADKGFKISGVSWNVVKVVILGNPTFQGAIVQDSNTVLFEILNYGDTPIYAGSHGLPTNKTVIKEKMEDVSMLQIKDHIGYYKHYKDGIGYKLLLTIPLFVGLGIVMALFSPAIRSRLT